MLVAFEYEYEYEYEYRQRLSTSTKAIAEHCAWQFREQVWKNQPAPFRFDSP